MATAVRKRVKCIHASDYVQGDSARGYRPVLSDVVGDPRKIVGRVVRRQGFAPDTFKVGEIVIVKGHPATSGSPGIDVLGKGTGVTREDGRSVPK